MLWAIPQTLDIFGVGIPFAFRSARITTHYSLAELRNLIEAVNKVCDLNRQVPVLMLLRINRQESSELENPMCTKVTQSKIS